MHQIRPLPSKHQNRMENVSQRINEHLFSGSYVTLKISKCSFEIFYPSRRIPSPRITPHAPLPNLIKRFNRKSQEPKHRIPSGRKRGDDSGAACTSRGDGGVEGGRRGRERERDTRDGPADVYANPRQPHSITMLSRIQMTVISFGTPYT